MALIICIGWIVSKFYPKKIYKLRFNFNTKRIKFRYQTTEWNPIIERIFRWKRLENCLLPSLFLTHSRVNFRSPRSTWTSSGLIDGSNIVNLFLWICVFVFVTKTSCLRQQRLNNFFEEKFVNSFEKWRTSIHSFSVFFICDNENTKVQMVKLLQEFIFKGYFLILKQKAGFYFKFEILTKQKNGVQIIQTMKSVTSRNVLKSSINN